VLREPFKELIVQGLVKAKTYKDKQGRYLSQEEPGCTVSFEKMSKSKGNGVRPEQVTAQFGVDALRASILFGAPPDVDLHFSDQIVSNMTSFLQKVSKLKPQKQTQSLQK
jgi:leucyl-tRNA synthetase